MSRPYAPAAAENATAIAQVLETRFGPGSVAEIGSGTGQHARDFVQRFPWFEWFPSEHPEMLAILSASIDEDRANGLADRLQPAVLLDVHAIGTQPAWPATWQRVVDAGGFDHVYTANTLHIVDEPGGQQLLAGAAQLLRPGGSFAVYGPFAIDGWMAASNRAFDQQLRAMDASMGVRDVSVIASLAADLGLELTERVAMPRDNWMLFFKRLEQVATPAG